MPHTSLVALTSPLLLGQVPVADAVTASAIAPQTVIATRAPDTRLPMMALTWSLVSAQEQGEGPPDEASESEEQATGEDGEIVVEATYGPPETDPMEQFNADAFRIMQGVDEALVAPLAYAYQDGLPGPLRTGLRNVVRNLGEPNNALNFLLQGKVGKAVETITRFAINSTLGLGGLIDIAGEPGIGLPYRRNGWANTFGYYGIGPGPYLVVPVAGSTTVRDVIGSGLDQALLPVVIGRPFNRPEYGIPVFVISSLQSRLEIDERLQRINASDDPYGSQRDGYLAEREAIIQEFRDGSPLQGIPDSERDAVDRLNPGPDNSEEEYDDWDADDEDGDSAALAPSLPEGIDAGQVAVTQPRTR